MVAWMLNCSLAELVLQSSTSMTAPGAGLPPRTLMQRPVLAVATLKLPFIAMAVMFQFCEALPLHPATTMPVPLVPAPASRHFPAPFIGEIVQLLPFGDMLKTEVARPADLVHCWMGEVPLSITIGLPAVALDESVYW